MDQDSEYLRLLSIFHYVLAGLVGLVSMFPLVHVGIGIAILTGQLDDGGDPPPAFFAWMLIAIPLAMVLVGLGLAIAIAIGGRKLQRQRSYVYCLVIAGIECMLFPIGTSLGVLTLIVLLRPTVKERFGVAPIA